jgi:hypothetical protein
LIQYLACVAIHDLDYRPPRSWVDAERHLPSRPQ